MFIPNFSRTSGKVLVVEYCDTPHIEREEKQRIQSIPERGGYDVYSRVHFFRRTRF